MNTVQGTDFEGKTLNIEVGKLQWRPSAYGVVIKDNNVLLLKQTNGYDLPGGGLDLGEMPEAGVVREIREETGLTVENPKLLGLETSFYKPFNTKDKYVQSLMIYYSCDLKAGEINNEGFDESEQAYAIGAEWVGLDELPNIALGTSVDFRKFITAAQP